MANPGATSTTSSTSDASSSSNLESFTLLANGTKGAAAVGLVAQVLEAPNVFVFGELLDHPNVAALGEAGGPADGQKFYKLLTIFAYEGTKNGLFF